VGPYKIGYGVLSVKQRMDSLAEKFKIGEISKFDRQLLKKLVKCFDHLQQNPRHPGLESHEISTLTQKYGEKVWQSYLENNTPAAGRVFWVYGPDKMQITIVGIEDHPKKGAYDRIKLDLPLQKKK
jgi:hypothetical protein